MLLLRDTGESWSMSILVLTCDPQENKHKREKTYAQWRRRRDTVEVISTCSHNISEGLSSNQRAFLCYSDHVLTGHNSDPSIIKNNQMVYAFAYVAQPSPCTKNELVYAYHAYASVAIEDQV